MAGCTRWWRPWQRWPKRKAPSSGYGAKAAEISVASGRVGGVRLASGEHVRADAVVVNADPGAVAAGLFGQAACSAVTLQAPASRSLSALT